MTTLWLRAGVALAMAGLVLSGCGQRSEQTSTSTEAQSHRTTTNPSTFPLYRPSEIVQVVPVDLGPMLVTMKRNDPHADVPPNYRGSEVIAGTSASIDQLRAWVHSLRTSPPQGLRLTDARTVSSGDPDVMRSVGAVVATFETANSGRVVVLMAVDPRLVREKLGSALDVVDKYQTVPGLMRGPIDDAVKKQIGYSVSELLDPHSPFGVILTTVKTMQSRNQRAIIVIDEHKG